MAKTPSTMKMKIGEIAPDFELWCPADNQKHTLTSGSSYKGYLVMFLCNHCPFVIHISEQLSKVCKQYQDQGVRVLGISSNDVDAYPEDGPDLMKKEVEKRGYTFPYLFDEDQSVAKRYKAACTPDFFLFDGEKKLIYRGQFDSSRPQNGIEVTGEDLSKAVENLVNGFPSLEKQIPSIGCNIKWRAGNEPSYF